MAETAAVRILHWSAIAEGHACFHETGDQSKQVNFASPLTEPEEAWEAFTALLAATHATTCGRMLVIQTSATRKIIRCVNTGI